jgi:hypothetical protein
VAAPAIAIWANYRVAAVLADLVRSVSATNAKILRLGTCGR